MIPWNWYCVKEDSAIPTAATTSPKDLYILPMGPKALKLSISLVSSFLRPSS